MSLFLRKHKRRAAAGMARRFARIPHEVGMRIYWRHWRRDEWMAMAGSHPGAMRWCRWMSWTWGCLHCEVGPRHEMNRGLRAS